MELSNSDRQRYRIKTSGKSPTEINKVLRKRGVRGFVVNVDPEEVTMLVEKKDKRHNKECMRCLTSTETRK
ncbi:hypothetical protein Q9Z25_001806 [Staphylococcus pseudintermedius]|uniref:hypothetical protein n=1 Tax=Staphylococcus pseudintermedius TaxID=283734 RepID=UPI0010357B81|nr:hypothetical protein [Staphylococcus pseudintermedius]EGQ3315100.1 hypothetical protein [Staphylococcus pseudintermedius]EGQ3325514.1 hypothetical protein [Staphylococcus pseudintermedius]EGQ3417517.1 hypothetical protein [Staphylococcus pseudintermedius]EGQ3621212.1 hypothetical protein [Staphylococcus pseudintermedius]EGQ3898524.1 hypothetical protein [Staphylococcus pseudintermedius]